MPTVDFSPATDVYPITLQLRPILPMDDTQFFELCQINRDLRMERTAEGDVTIMMLAGGEMGARNVKLGRYLDAWAEDDDTGIAFDSSTGFILPNGATRSPDAAWVLRSRLSDLAPEEKKRFLPLAPDFVVELRSPTDSLPALLAKMEQYRANGVRLGWLIDPFLPRVSVYIPDDETAVLEKPDSLQAGSVLPGFTLPLARIWNPGF